MTASTRELHSNEILFAAAIGKVNLIQSSCICKMGLFDFIHAGLFFHLTDEGGGGGGISGKMAKADNST